MQMNLLTHLSAVIRRREEGDQLTFCEEFVSVFHYLMGTADEVHIVLLQEPRHDVWAECERNTSVVLAPSRDVFIRI